jgi:hypothetical protein
VAAGKKRVDDRVLDQCPARAGADLALVEGEHGEALEALVVERVLGPGAVLEEHDRALAAELEADRDQVLAGVLHDQPAGGGLAGEGDLADPAGRSQRLAGFGGESVDHVEHALGQDVGEQFHQQHDRGRGQLGGLEHDGVAGGQRGRQLAISSGKFQGMIWPTTPSGSWKW